MYQTICFVDFDGTITTQETLDGAMRRCLPQHLYQQGLERLLSGACTLKETVRYAFDHIPSTQYDAIMSYVRSVPIRPGFGAFLDCMQALDIPVVIISGGLKPYVEETLAPYRHRLLHIYSVALDTSGPFMKLHTDYEGESDLLEKRAVMARYTYERAICVGDSLTDLRMAMQSDVVFARDTLAQLLREREIPFTRWEDFYDVCRGVASLTS